MLSNPEKRKIYDQGGEQAIKEGGSGGGGGGFHSPMDIFDMFFGGGDPFGRGGGRQRGPRRTKNLVHQLRDIVLSTSLIFKPLNYSLKRIQLPPGQIV